MKTDQHCSACTDGAANAGAHNPSHGHLLAKTNRRALCAVAALLIIVTLLLAGPAFAEGTRIWAPWTTQLDGSLYSRGNCGPASLQMAMSYYGEVWSVSSIRRDVIAIDGDPAYDAGSSWQALAYAAEKRDFIPVGLFGPGGAYNTWYLDGLVEQAKKGRPVLLLTRYAYLPGHEYDSSYIDHYIVFLGVTADGRVIYHDAAYDNEGQGAYRTMTEEQLVRAWVGTASGLQRTAMALVW